MAIDVFRMGIPEFARQFRARELTSRELTETYLRRVERFNPRLNAYLKVFTDEAVEAATAADAELVRGVDRGPLHGIPIALKDNIDVRGHVTTAGAIILPDEPAREDAEVVRRLREAGAVLLGKLNMHELAWGGTNDNPHFGRCENPWRAGYTPAGSSGGSASAVAAGLCAAALGTDTNGSIRAPASFCSCVGLRPTFGLVSTCGSFPLSWSLDTIGPLARSMEDTALLLAAIAGPDAMDPTSSMRQTADLAIPESAAVEGIRLGVVKDFSLSNDGSGEEIEVTEAVIAAIECLTGLGARRIDVEIPEMALAAEACFTIALAEAAALHREAIARCPEKIGADVLERLRNGAALPATELADALYRKMLLHHRMRLVRNQFDVLIMPTCRRPAQPFGPSALIPQRFNRAIALLGCPSISVPCGFSREGLPIGLQIVAPPFEERLLFTVAKAYEAATPWKDAHPSGFDA